jgi:hypothetical protein
MNNLVTVSERSMAKQALRAALANHHGDPTQPAVAAAIAGLAALTPHPAPARHPDLIGNWRLLSAPSFPDGERQSDGTYAYTLGRLAFNMFPPQDLSVVIHQVWQPVFPITDTHQYTHDIVVKFTPLSDTVPALAGIIRNLAVCQPSSDTELQVKFTGGVLEPAEGTDLKAWTTLFAASAAAHRLTWKGWWQTVALKVMFGLVPPDAMEAASGRLEFKMQRSPKGTLTILYLDDELRITRGQRETVLVCERI